MTKQHQLSADKAINFIFEGKAIFTIQSKRTGKYFTYRVKTPKNPLFGNKEVHFVGLLTGPDNTTNYSYIGTIFDKVAYVHCKKSKISEDALGVQAFKWFLKHINANNLNDHITFYHEGRCCRCGRTLTTPESVENAIGPECVKVRIRKESNRKKQLSIAI